MFIQIFKSDIQISFAIIFGFDQWISKWLVQERTIVIQSSNGFPLRLNVVPEEHRAEEMIIWLTRSIILKD